ncbi:hypothetical protein [Methylobacterium durans]|uniref:Flagellin n=1 Tax=Methylobacterium durans TaxID=2202825 RepID=A0A2U8W8U7_9HYPH|nr:hypothetical protein [Methylobacterium durans]AWN41870.1 hypothetical protein DK389_16905 [Methylobacterium durans]
MTTISSFAAGSYITNRNTQNIVNLKDQIDTLSTQLSTGRASETYGGLGSGRVTSLSAHATLSALDGYDAAIDSAKTRVALASASVSQVIQLSTTLGTGLSNNILGSASATTNAQLARTTLDAALDTLNQQSAGQYLFGGRITDIPPVLSSDTILKGDAAKGLAGLTTLVQEQKAADLGAPDNTGRLKLTPAPAGGTTLRLGEDPNDPTGESRANFGFRFAQAPVATGTGIAVTQNSASAPTTAALNRAPQVGESFRVVVNQPDGSQKTLDLTVRNPVPPGSTDSFPLYPSAAAASAALNALGGEVASFQSAATPAITATFSGGQPAAYDIAVNTQPNPGDTVTISLKLHDGTTTKVTLTAKAPPATGSPGEFVIGADTAATAQNLGNTLKTALQTAASGPLSASSTTRASKDFFAGSPVAGFEPRRITTSASGTPVFAQAPQNKTVIWYQGEDSGTAARDTAAVRIGANRDLAVGGRANEPAFQEALAGMAALAVEMLADPAGAVTNDRFAALADRTSAILTNAKTSPGLPEIASDYSLASAALSGAEDHNRTTRATLQDSLDGIETAPMEDVAAKLLAVQNRLQASYQVTSMLSKLSLVNYL